MTELPMVAAARYLVTGAATGIGAAVTRRLVTGGSAVLGIGLDDDEGRALEVEMRGTAGGSEKVGEFAFRAIDVTDETAMADLAVELGGTGLDGLVVCAGIYPPDRRLDETTAAEFRQVLEVNVVGAFLACKAALPALRSSKRPTGTAIVTVSSVHAIAAAPGQGPYAASKGALLSMTRQLAVDYAADGVRANSVLAGSVDTRITRAAIEAAGGAAGLGLSQDPRTLGRIADADEIASVVEFLLDDRSRFITGAALLADGGLTARIL